MEQNLLGERKMGNQLNKISGGNFGRRLQNLSCAFAQIAIKDFEYRKQKVFCPFQIEKSKKFGKNTENKKFSVCSFSGEKFT